MTPRLTPRQLEFLGKLAERGSLVLYYSYEDIPEYGLSQADVDALVTLRLHRRRGAERPSRQLRKAVLTDASRAELERRRSTS